MVTVINNKKNIGSTIVNSTYFRIPITVHVKTTLLKTVTIRVYTISTQINSKYLPANVPTEAIYNEDDLIKIAISKDKDSYIANFECVYKLAVTHMYVAFTMPTL